MARLLRRVPAEELQAQGPSPRDPEAAAVAGRIVEDVRTGGEPALRTYAERFDGLDPGAPLVLGPSLLDEALASLAADERALLERTAGRIRSFAEAQRDCLAPLDVPVPGGRAGHRWLPVASAGAYAPGGRYPLPSSVLMTAVPARVAGVERVWLASPRPTRATLAAAAVAGVDAVIPVGGAQAIAALALGTLGPPVDVLAGPGNRYVTAAKRHLYGEVGLDGLAGPSELVVVADASADPASVAADLLAQAEHDPRAVAVLVTTAPALLEQVEAALEAQLAELPTQGVAGAALRSQGAGVLVQDLEAAARLVDRLAPEHLHLAVAEPRGLAEALRSYGALFVGGASGEVFGDYGAGPNHVLPTGGGARYQAGLSVLTYLRPATFLELEDPGPLARDTAALARLEGLEAHARAAEQRPATLLR